MDFDYSQKTKDLLVRLNRFMDEHVYPNEHLYQQQLDAAVDRWHHPPILDELKEKARAAGLWNLFLPDSHYGPGLTNVEYAPLCEVMGRIQWAGEIFNCSAPDTGNMETIERYGTEAHKKEWLEPLLDDGDDYVINGRKWWTSGAGDPRCKIFIFMGKTDPAAPTHRQQSMVLVPRDTPGITVMRHLPVFGYDHAPHGHMEVDFKDVRVPVSNILLGEGRGFEIAQGRLGPGRIHHAMRMIGLAERALEYMCKRTKSRVAFGKPISEQTVTLERIAEARIMIDSARLLVLRAAYMMDTVGNKVARSEIAQIKVLAPNMACQVIDWAIQAHGGGGVSDDFPLAYAYAHARTIRLADGPDEVHRNQIGRLELKKYEQKLSN
jgi:acyl-CoA dehydrogenase